MELKGTVLNVVDFGAFVDIGLKDSGLVHISQLANRYIKSPHDVVSVGDVVTVWVMGVDHERKRVSLTMVKPGHRASPRRRGGGGGGRRGGPGAARRPGRRRASPGESGGAAASPASRGLLAAPATRRTDPRRRPRRPAGEAPEARPSPGRLVRDRVRAAARARAVARAGRRPARTGRARAAAARGPATGMGPAGRDGPRGRHPRARRRSRPLRPPRCPRTPSRATSRSGPSASSSSCGRPASRETSPPKLPRTRRPRHVRPVPSPLRLRQPHPRPPSPRERPTWARQPLMRVELDPTRCPPSGCVASRRPGRRRLGGLLTDVAARPPFRPAVEDPRGRRSHTGSRNFVHRSADWKWEKISKGEGRKRCPPHL